MKSLVHGPASLFRSAAALLSILLLAAVCVPSLRSFAARGAPALPGGLAQTQSNSCGTTEQCLQQLSAALESLSPEQLAALGAAIRTQLTSLASKPVEVAGAGEVGGSTTPLEDQLRKLLVAGTYVAGLAFAIAAIAKYQAHKINPTKPIEFGDSMLFIAAALIFAPSIFQSVGGTMFGQGGIDGVVEGIDNLQP